MIFPLGMNGSIRLKIAHYSPSLTSTVNSRIEQMLDDADASSASLDGDKVCFTSGFFRPVGSWNILGPFGSGKIWAEMKGVDTLVVRYRLSTVQLFVTVTGVLGALAIFLLFVSGSSEPGKTLQSLGIGWAWLFGANYVTGLIRFPSWLRRGILEVPELTNR